MTLHARLDVPHSFLPAELKRRHAHSHHDRVAFSHQTFVCVCCLRRLLDCFDSRERERQAWLPDIALNALIIHRIFHLNRFGDHGQLQLECNSLQARAVAPASLHLLSRSNGKERLERIILAAGH